MIKPEIRIIGIDDGYFDKKKDRECLVVGVVMRSYKQIDAVLSTKVTVDGDDATEKIAKMINRSRQKPQLRVIMINGVTVAGFNVIDIQELYTLTELPVIVVTRNKPNFDEIYRAIQHVPNWEEKWRKIKKAGDPQKILVRNGILWYQFYGIEKEKVEQIIRLTAVYSIIPEPGRVAHLIAEGITLGESHGKP